METVRQIQKFRKLPNKKPVKIHDSFTAFNVFFIIVQIYLYINCSASKDFFFQPSSWHSKFNNIANVYRYYIETSLEKDHSKMVEVRKLNNFFLKLTIWIALQNWTGIRRGFGFWYSVTISVNENRYAIPLEKTLSTRCSKKNFINMYKTKSNKQEFTKRNCQMFCHTSTSYFSNSTTVCMSSISKYKENSEKFENKFSN